MENPFSRAFRDTLRSYGLSRGEIVRKVITAVGTVAALYLILGEEVAMSEAWVIVAALVAAAVGTFLPEFLWNLWLAPYRIMNERLDEIAATQATPSGVDQEEAERNRLAMKRRRVREEMNRLRFCARHKSDSHITRRGEDRDLGHDYAALMEKYRDWIPGDRSGQALDKWIGRIIATLKAMDYTAVESRIERAAAQGSWDEDAVATEGKDTGGNQ